MKRICLITFILLTFAVMLSSCAGVKVTFDIGDVTLVSGDTVQEYKEDSPISAPTVEREGYVFVGWDKDFSSPDEDMTVTPIWKKLHTVTFDIADAEAKDSALLTQKIIDGENVQVPEVTRDGYVFDGWDTDISIAVSQDMTVTAKWKKIHTVKFDLDGGHVSEDDEALLTQSITDGMGAELFVPTRDKYNFVKWDTDVSAVTKDVTVKAVWERKTFSSTEIYELINPATVEISACRLNGFCFGTGSGFFISEDGLLLTNYHVIHNARVFKVKTHDGKVYEVSKVISYDIKKDIAVLKVNSSNRKFSYLDITEELPKTGEAVWALGSSLGLTGTFSSGIVSYVNRVVDGVNFIQSTAPISAGNSGGPLVNEKGYVIGINSASYTEGQNLNLAVEISQYKTLSKVNLTPERLFQKESSLKYWIGESLVQETSDSETTAQVIKNGKTVCGTHDGGEFYDMYMINAPQEDSILLVMIKADSEEALLSIASYLAVFAADDGLVNGDFERLPDVFLSYTQLVEDANGECYYLAMIPVPQELGDEYQNIGVGIASDDPCEYDLFMYYITEDMIDDLL